MPKITNSGPSNAAAEVDVTRDDLPVIETPAEVEEVEEELDAENETPDELSADGFANSAREECEAGNFDGARELIKAAADIDPSRKKRWDRLTANIDKAEAEASSK